MVLTNGNTFLSLNTELFAPCASLDCKIEAAFDSKH